MNKITSLVKSSAESLNLKIHIKSNTESTNTWAKEHPLENDVELFSAEEQTKGRGRGENSWASNGQGDQIFLSLAFQMSSAPQPVTTAKVGRCICNTLKAFWPQLPWNLKAPNDIYCGHKKLGGILTEVIQQGNQFKLIIGVGLNIYSSPNLDIATSLKEQDETFDSHLENFLLRLLSELTRDKENYSTGVLTDEECEDLLSLLNAHPLLQTPYINVQKDGSLATTTANISWQSL